MHHLKPHVYHVHNDVHDVHISIQIYIQVHIHHTIAQITYVYVNKIIVIVDLEIKLSM